MYTENLLHWEDIVTIQISHVINIEDYNHNNEYVIIALTQ